jgi:hypothetical protein
MNIKDIIQVQRNNNEHFKTQKKETKTQNSNQESINAGNLTLAVKPVARR